VACRPPARTRPTGSRRTPPGNLTGNEAKIAIPSVNWDVPAAPAPNPGGGLAEVTLGGAMQNPGGATQPYTIDVWNADNAAYTGLMIARLRRRDQREAVGRSWCA
jgi:hypothetical protein